MMRKLLFYLLGLILVGGAAAAIVIAAKNSKSHDDNSNTAPAVSAKNSQSPKKACDVFTLADAKQILGDTAKGGTNPIFDTPQGDLNVTTCTYTQDTGSNAPVASSKSASLLVRSPKTDKGITSNQNAFGAVKPTGVQDVDGYGDQAYWDAEHGQLNILKNNIWYILSYGPITPAQRTLDQAKQLADILITKM